MKCLIIGGGGPVGVSLLYLCKQLGWTVAVVDPVRPPHWDVHERDLAGTLTHWAQHKYDVNDLDQRLTAERFDVVVDLSPTLDKRNSIVVCDKHHVHMVNGTMVDCKDDIHIAAYNFVDSRPETKNVGHIAASGMNPGAINAMAEDIIREHGQPDSIVYWEYDDTMPPGGYRGPAITWCLGESAAEIGEDWNFEVVEEGTVLLHEDALSWQPETYRTCGVPHELVAVPPGGEAFLIGHEECIYMGWRHDTAVKFIYGFHAENMRLIREAGWGFKPELLVRKSSEELVGGDIVGVSCQYGGDWRGSYVLLNNSAEIPYDTNATCWLVAAGVAASMKLLEREKLRTGIHLTHELPRFMNGFRELVEVHEFMIAEGKAKALPQTVRLTPAKATKPATQEPARA